MQPLSPHGGVHDSVTRAVVAALLKLCAGFDREGEFLQVNPIGASFRMLEAVGSGSSDHPRAHVGKGKDQR